VPSVYSFSFMIWPDNKEKNGKADGSRPSHECANATLFALGSLGLSTSRASGRPRPSYRSINTTRDSLYSQTFIPLFVYYQ
jgi:hypothetical protein